jgi:hypothetical protein
MVAECGGRPSQDRLAARADDAQHLVASFDRHVLDVRNASLAQRRTAQAEQAANATDIRLKRRILEDVERLVPGSPCDRAKHVLAVDQ